MCSSDLQAAQRGAAFRWANTQAQDGHGPRPHFAGRGTCRRGSRRERRAGERRDPWHRSPQDQRRSGRRRALPGTSGALHRRLDPAGPGVFVFTPDATGKRWTKHIIDNGEVATEDLISRDLTGDGWPEIVAVGRATKNVRLYVNVGKKQ